MTAPAISNTDHATASSCFRAFVAIAIGAATALVPAQATSPNVLLITIDTAAIDQLLTPSAAPSAQPCAP